MSQEGTVKLTDRLESVIATSRMCKEVTYAELCGALEMIKFSVLQEAFDDSDDED